MAAAALALALALSPSAVAAEPEDGRPEVATATGYGIASGPVDVAYVQIGIAYESTALAGVVRKTDAAAARVRRLLLGRGVPARDVLSTRLGMARFYQQAHGEFSPRYQADRVLAVVFRDTDRAEEITYAAVAAGGDHAIVNEFTFGVSEKRLNTLTKTARAIAFADARAQAAAEARRVGRPLEAVHTIVEELNRPYETRRLRRDLGMTSGGSTAFLRSTSPAGIDRRKGKVGIEIQSTVAWDLGHGPDTPRTVSVVGVGAAKGPARDVVARIELERTGKDASAVRRQVAAGVRRIRNSLAGQGIRARDVRTTYSGVLPSQKAFQARQVLDVTLRDVDAAERTIVAAATAGGPDAGVSTFRYTVGHRRELVRIATAAAVAHARSMTEQYAALAGLPLGTTERLGTLQQTDRPYPGTLGVPTGPQPIQPGPDSIAVGVGQVEVLAPMTRALG